MQVDTDVFAALTERAEAADRLGERVAELVGQVGILTARITALTARITALSKRAQAAARLAEIVHGDGHEAEYAVMSAEARQPRPRPARDRQGLRLLAGGRR